MSYPFGLPIKELKLLAKQLIKDNKKLPKKMTRIPTVVGPLSLAASERPGGSPLIEVWRSCKFLCQIYDEGDVERLSICRTEIDVNNRRWKDGITWEELDQVKHEVGRTYSVAIEFYPPPHKLINDANLRHLWVYKKTPDFPFMWGN